MQFKYPELLWAFFLLLIPLFIHFFQLRRFKKTPFTNVKLLQKVIAESRKSNTLKKWLLLLTRLSLFSVLILAFARPFLANTTALAPKETVVYLDNSFSMWAKDVEGTLIHTAVQDLLKSIPNDNTFSLFTNTEEYKDVQVNDINNELLGISPTPKQLGLEEIELKAGTFFSNKENTIKNLIIISDFQNHMAPNATHSDSVLRKHLVKLSGTDDVNISLDSCFISNSGTETSDISVLLSASPAIERSPVSLFNKERLIAKSTAFFEKGKSEVTFTIPANEKVMGKLEITDKGLPYDNRLYFNIDEKDKPKVLAIEHSPSEFLPRIYTGDSFDFSSFSLKNLNYRDLESQNLIILNGLLRIPNPLITSLLTFVSEGGSMVIIPAADADIAAYNQLLAPLAMGTFVETINAQTAITQIAFSHPLFDQVFEKKVENFQYPQVNGYFKLKSPLPNILTYQSGDAFLVGNKGLYLYTAALELENSNFQQSPLIVPTFYKMGINSLKPSLLYFELDRTVEMDISRTLAKDHILKVSKGELEFIPQQKTLANKVSLTFNENPTEDGIYSITEDGTTLKHISFNNPRKESEFLFMDIDQIKGNSRQSSIPALFEALQNDDRITELWKWFVILALFFLLIEVLLIKYIK